MCGVEGGESCALFRRVTMYKGFQKHQLSSHPNFESTQNTINMNQNEVLWNENEEAP